MANHLENMVLRLEGDPFFLACPLTLFAKSEGLDAIGLAAALNCSHESLVQIRLCRAPESDAESFCDGIQQIATKFGVDSDVLAQAVRRGQAVYQMTRNTKPLRTLLAARDGEAASDPDHNTKGNP